MKRQLDDTSFVEPVTVASFQDPNSPRFGEDNHMQLLPSNTKDIKTELAKLRKQLKRLQPEQSISPVTVPQTWLNFFFLGRVLSTSDRVTDPVDLRRSFGKAISFGKMPFMVQAIKFVSDEFVRGVKREIFSDAAQTHTANLRIVLDRHKRASMALISWVYLMQLEVVDGLRRNPDEMRLPLLLPEQLVPHLERAQARKFGTRATPLSDLRPTMSTKHAAYVKTCGDTTQKYVVGLPGVD